MLSLSRPVIAWGALTLSGCARLFGAQTAAPAVPAELPNQSAPILDGAQPPALSNDDDYVVRIVVGSVACSGTLIQDDRVLTAHHCVAARDSNGSVLPREVPPDQIRVELGGDYLPWGEVGVRAVIAPNCGYVSGDGDLAVLVLEHRLVGVATRPVQLEPPPNQHDHVEPIGFGRCALSADGVHRKHRAGGSIELVSAGRFRLSAAICPGDSGGPALSGSSGEILGVISASAMDGDELTRDRSEFVRVDPWRALFANAALVSSGTSPSELPPIECK
ncbi:MAG: trypsin-like serine protease [Polyangiaceae bacterium]